MKELEGKRKLRDRGMREVSGGGREQTGNDKEVKMLVFGEWKEGRKEEGMNEGRKGVYGVDYDRVCFWINVSI